MYGIYRVVNTYTDINGELKYLSLRSTGERLSNTSSGSFRIAFQFPTPHYMSTSVTALVNRIGVHTLLQPFTNI